MKPFKDCKYSAFISYAHDDDIAEQGWVGKFAGVLKAKLQNRLGRVGIANLQPMHLSGHNGPVVGSLRNDLQANVADSYAMIIVVHNKYVLSEWCLQELAYFRKTFGEAGLRERLYIVAMSASAMAEVTAKPSWRDLALEDQLWIPFFRDDEPDRPARVKLDNDELSQRFDDQLEKLLGSLGEAIKQDVKRPPPPRPTQIVQTPDATPRLSGGALLFGVPAPELAAPVTELADQLSAGGVPVAVLGVESLEGEFLEFDSADTLILAFGTGGTHLKPFKFSAGGHLAAQRDAWLGKGRPEGGLIWLDLRDVACDTPAGKGHADLIAEIAAKALKRAALLERFTPAAEPGGREEAPPSPDDHINIYIESNQHDIDLWEDLGERIKSKWDEVVAQVGNPEVPTLRVRARGLPMQKIDEERLDDADGVVLLWGKKPEDSLRAQIRKVESRLPRNPPPGIVAYLMPQQPDPRQMMEATYWKVLRFQDANSSKIDVVPDEADRLQKFLQRIFDRSAKKLGTARSPRPGSVQ